MSEEKIEQILGFNASQALDTLKLLDTGFSTFEKRLESTARRIQYFNQITGRTTNAFIQIERSSKGAAKAMDAVNSATPRDAAADAQAATTATQQIIAALSAAGNEGRSASIKIGEAFIRIGRDSKKSSEEVKSSIQRMTTSLALLSRIVFTQAIVRALSQLRNAFRQTVGDALQFQKSLALIATIDDSNQSLGQLSDRVREISDQFNIGLLETAAGLYQTISNQVGDAAESTRFLGEAAKFARATNSNLENSVDLLSGVLKSYNLDIAQSGRVSSIFFKTIDLGRISADQLANAFGRVGPAAASLGVELEEVGAAIAAISVRGSDTAQALTQFRNILTALTKPSVAMQRTMRELGFASAELAIKTLGVSGVLRELVGSADGSSEALARLFPNIRGLNGVAALTADELLTFAQNTDEMTAAGNKFVDSKFLQAIATDAEVVTNQINRLKNAFTVDLGQALLRTGVQITEFTGGLDHFTEFVKASPSAVLGFATSITVLGTALTTAKLAGIGLSRALAGISLAPLAIGLGNSIGEFLDTKLLEKNFTELKKLQEANAQEIRKFADELQSATDDANRADKDRLKAVLQVSREISAAYLSQSHAAMDANTSLVKNTTASVTQIIQAFQRLTEAETQATARALDLQDDSANRVIALEDKLADIDFEKRTRSFTDERKALALNQRSAEFASLAARTLATAGGDQDKLNRGLNLFEQAKKSADASLALANQIGDERTAKRSKDQLRLLIEQQIKAEERLQNLQTVRIAGIQRERTAHQGLLDQVRAQTKVIQDNTGIFDQTGTQFSSIEQEKRAERRTEALKKLVDLSKQIDPKKLRDLGLEGFIDQFQSQLLQDPIRLSFTIDAETKRVKEQLTASFDTFEVQLKLKTGVDTSELAAVLGKTPGTFNTPAKVFQGLDLAAAEAAEIRSQLNNIQVGGETGLNIRKEIDKLLAQAARLEQARNATGQSGAPARAAFDLILNRLKEVQAQSEITTGDIEPLFNALKTFNQGFQDSGLQIRSNFNSSTQTLNLLLGKLGELQRLQTEAAGNPAATELQAQLARLDALQQSFTGPVTPLSTAGLALTTGANAISGATSPSETIKLNAQATQSALEAGAKALMDAAKSGPAPIGGFNGLIKPQLQHFAAGGFARGVDSVPTMLAKGESVITAKNTQRFFSQIQAMNAGQRPVFRSDGGSVDNSVHVGDVVVQGEKAVRIRELVREINRESRRGSSRIR